MTMVLYTLRFPNKIDLDVLDKVSEHIIKGHAKYQAGYAYNYNARVINDEGISISVSPEAFCRETFTGYIRRAFAGKRKNMICLVWCNEARHITHELLSDGFVDFATEFLSRSGVPEIVTKTSAKVAHVGLGVVFPITMGDSMTRYTSASALVLLLRGGNLLVNTDENKMEFYCDALKRIAPRVRRTTSWWSENRATIGASTFIWYLLHYFDLFPLVSKQKAKPQFCNGPQTYFSGNRKNIISAIEKFDDITRIELIDKTLKGNKTLLSQLSSDFRETFRSMLSKLPPKVRKIKGASL